MRNLRIGIVIPNLCGGGAERVAVNLANCFSQRGYLVDMILLSARGDFLDDLLPEIRVVDLKARRMRGALMPLIHYLRNERPIALLANMWPITSISMLACKLAMADTRLVVVEHTTWSRSEICKSKFKRWQVSTLMHYTFPFVDCIVAVSEGAADDLASFADLNRNNIKVIYNPIVGNCKGIAKEHSPHVAGWSDSNYRVLAVGKLKVVKDFSTLLNAFLQVLTRLDAKLLILGDGECRAALELQIKQLGIEGKVFMPGFVKDIAPFYQQADLFVLSSISEGLPTVIIEAIAAGTPVVSTDCPTGPREILSHGKFGDLVPVRNSEALALAIVQSLNTPHNRTALIARAQDFSIDKAAEKYIALLLGGKCL
jgi:glycosyltransferase involved in cell wall biosynthesis